MSSSPLIALYAPSLAGGGIADVFTNLARGFTEAGYSVDVLLAHKQGPYLERIPPDVRVVDFEARHVSLTLLSLVRYLRTRRPVVLFTAPCNVSLVAVVAKRLAAVSTRIVATEHSIFSKTLHRAKGVKVRMLLALARRAYAYADTIVAVSEDAAESLAACTRLTREQIEVIHNPIVVPDLPVGGSRNPSFPWSFGRELPLLLGAGRLTLQKDFPTLLRAFARLRKRRPARLVLLGEGEERTALEALAERLGVRASLHMPGFVDDPYTYMRAASVFVLSSRDEPFGNVLVEAMACGTPVVSTNCPGGPPEILQGGALAPMVPVGDASALADAISATLEAPPSGEALKRRAEDFSLERAVEAYLSLLD